MTKRFRGFGLVVAVAILAAGCAAGQAFRHGEAAMRSGNLDEAVVHYRKAVQAAPDNPNYKIALERAMVAASRAHLDRAKEFEANGQLEAALGEYRQASEYDPSNRTSVAKVAELDRTIRERIEASRPRPPIEAMRQRARAASAEPVLNPASREPLNIGFPNTSLRDILNFIANATGINITYDRDVQDRLVSITLNGVTLEEALNQIMTMNQLSYKIVNDRTILVFPDQAPKHAQYDEQVVRTFYVSHADATEVAQILSTIIRLPGVAVVPAIVPNKTANTITVRATAPVVQIMEKIIQQNDKPRAEIVIDVEILEVDRSRTKSYGLNLSEYSLGTIFSPETSPSSLTTGAATGGTGGTGTTPGGTTTTTTGTSTSPTGVRSPAPFNLNPISRGVSTADFYLAVPTAIVNFLESDTHTRIIAKPQIRGAEGAKFTLKLGDKVPVISTSYTPIATGGAGVNPLSSYQYQDVGVNLDITPRVTLEGDILLDLTIEDTSRKADVVIGGVNIPSFGQRTVTTRLRLRDGESNLLAGLLQENSNDSIKGFPGAIHVPVLKQLFSGNNKTIDQTDIVMLLTPHIVRTHEITEDDLKPLFIGSQQNLGVGGPPPLFAPPLVEPPPAPAPPAPAAQPGFATGTPPNEIASTPNPNRGPGGAVVSAPPGSSPVPGTVLVTPAPPTQPPAAVPPTTPEPVPAPVAPPAPPTGTPPGTQPAPQPQGLPPSTPTTAPTTAPGIGSAQILISPPGTTFRVGGGPYTVPISIADASRITTITLTLVYDPTKLRVRSVQEGSFMRSGGVTASFSQQVTGNRIDITLVRTADATGASGTGLLAAVLFDAIAPGANTFTVSGTATGPGGATMGLRFTPVTVTVQ
jgi:general secretion pathway protein D